MIQGFRHGGAYGPGAGMGRLRGQFQQRALDQRRPQQLQQMQRLQQMQPSDFNPQQLGQQIPQTMAGISPIQKLKQLSEERISGFVPSRTDDIPRQRFVEPQITGFPAPQPPTSSGYGAPQAGPQVGVIAPGFAKPISSSPSAGGGDGAGGPPTSWKMSIEPMAYGGMVPGYQAGGEHDPEKIARMKEIVRLIEAGDPEYANRSPFGENPEENEWYRKNILPEEKRTFGGTVVPLDSINYAVSDAPSLRVSRGHAPELAGIAKEALLYDWEQDNPDSDLKMFPSSRQFGSDLQNPRRLPEGGYGYTTVVPYSRYAMELKARARAREREDTEPMFASGGIIGLAGGGYIPMYAGGGIPGYWGGGFLRGLGKVISKAAPLAMNFIPGAEGLSGLAKAGIGALAQGAGDLASDKGLNVQSMLGGAGRAYALSSAVDRLRDIKGLEDENLWGSLGKVLTDKDIGKEAMSALADIPFSEAMGLAVTEKAGERGAQQQAQDAGGFTGMVSPMGTTGRVMPGSGGADIARGYASDLTYGRQPIDYSQAVPASGGGMIPAFQEGGEYEDEDEVEGGREPHRYRSSRGSRRRRAPAARDIREDIEEFVPETVAAMRPPPPPVFDPTRVDVANQQAELAAQQQAASRRQPPPPPVFDPTQVGDLDNGGDIELPPVPRPRAQPQPQPKPFVDDEEPIDQQLASQLPYTIPQPQGPQPPPGVPVFDPTKVDLQNAIEQEKAQEWAVTQGAKSFVPSDEEGQGLEGSETWRPEPTVRVNVPEQLTDEQLDNLDETMFAPDEIDTVGRHEGPEETFTPDTGRPTKVIEPPPGVQVFDPNKVVKADEEATTTALENMLKMDPDNEDAKKRLERKYEKRNEAAAIEVGKTGVPTGPMRAAVPTPATTEPPPSLATRAGSGAGSGFHGEQKWFDPNAPAPAERDIGGFNPHELPRTAADFTAAGDTGGAGLLDRLNAPAAPVQNYLSPVPVPGAAEGGLISQVPMEDLEKLARAAQQIESPGSQQIIEQAIDDYGLELVQQIIKAIQEQGPMMAPDGAVPGYGIGGFLKRLGKVAAFGPTQLLPEKIRDSINKFALKAAPIAANFLPIPGAGPLLSAGVGAVARGLEGKIDSDRARDAAAEQGGVAEQMSYGQEEMAAPQRRQAPQPQRYMPDPAAQQGLAGQMNYGQEDWARGGLIHGGGGDAMADDILVNATMGMNGETQEIAVSDGEYIFPGDALAHLGSGNSEKGGEVMDQFIKDIRVQRTGSPEQPPPIDLRDVLPGTYGGRYA